MLVKVKLFATLRDNRENERIMDLPSDANIKDVLKHLDIPEEDVAIVFRNGRGVKFDNVLEDNDTLSIFPPVGGG